MGVGFFSLGGSGTGLKKINFVEGEYKDLCIYFRSRLLVVGREKGY